MTTNKVLYMTVGLPRSGKSTWCRQQGIPVVCPDEIRLAIHGKPFIKTAEPYVWAIAKTMVKALFGAGHNIVILDACNGNKHTREQWHSRDWNVYYKPFKASPAECLERPGADDLVQVIHRMARHWDPPEVTGEWPWVTNKAGAE